MSRCAVFLLLLVLGFVEIDTSHFRGALITWAPTGNGTEIEISFRISWRRGSEYCDQETISSGTLIFGDLMSCFSNCGSTEVFGSLDFFCTDYSVVDDWTTGRNSFTYNHTSTGVFTFGYSGGSWIDDMNYGSTGDWRLVVKADLSLRRDTGTINSSPTVEVVPVIELKYGCSHQIVFPVSDADGDVIRCRFSTSDKNECADICDGFPGSTMDQERCVLSYTANDSLGFYPVALQVEDFDSPTSNTALSSVPVQFLVYIYSSSDVCGSEPEFTSPTPANGDRFCLATGSAFVLNVTATGTNNLTEIQTISPLGLQRTSQVTWTNQTAHFMSFNLSWSPGEESVGEHTVCLVPKDSEGLTGSQRCMFLSVYLAVCPDPSPENGSVVCHDFSAFSAVQIQCEKGFQVKGNETVTCLPNGTWTDNVTCAEIKCTDPTPSDGFVNTQDFSINSTVAVQCNDGFSLNGNENVTCLPNGLWTHIVTCSKLGSKSTPSYVYGIAVAVSVLGFAGVSLVVIKYLKHQTNAKKKSLIRKANQVSDVPVVTEFIPEIPRANLSNNSGRWQGSFSDLHK